ncbi:peroxiredoxin [Deinococcus piscis]|uniref:thioredoxin-dependent peroxiredoxin n=1 Tax=Deinococcus piscis TaxID=394230 RepID=A0ABQ3K4E5_9DEIO|nr:peroxiredoxin [Deinococcus piscis]GHF99605.1 peroxiredoxin [Deinococcus piscis]
MTDNRLQAGEAFPAFMLPDGQGQSHALSDYVGRYVVLYAYPKDDTPGCTREACDFRDSARLREMGAVILGISQDDAASHQRFAEKYSLPFPLLTDDGEFLASIGAYGEKNSYGKVTQGVKRSTFIIDPEGKLVKSWLAVKVDGHAEAVADAIAGDMESRA